MKKTIILVSLFLAFSTSKAQEISYGLVLGGEAFMSANNSGGVRFSVKKSFITNFGGYAEYNFNNKIGIKTELTFNKKQVTYHYFVFDIPQKQAFDLSFFEISPSLKYDFGDEYRRGFYMLIGPKVSFITTVTADTEDAKKIFNTTNIGAHLGFGQRIAKIADLQLKLDYEITPFFETTKDRQSNFAGAYISLNIDIESIIKVSQ